MQYQAVQRAVGAILALFGLTMSLPILVHFIYQDGGLKPFVDGGLIITAVGAIAWITAKKPTKDLRLREGFLIVACTWVFCGLLGALPFVLAPRLHMSYTDAVFETISGLTTTGATMLSGLDTLPHSILYYRAQLHWFGGMGIIVLGLAILPLLGVGGMQLFRAETPGPSKEKMTPRVTETAKTLWLIYFGITFCCALSYWLAGMSLFDAICNSYSTIATGGFTPHASFAFYHSRTIELIATFFMFIAGANFALHFSMLRTGSIKTYFRNPEFRFYFIISAIIVAAMTLALWLHGVYHSSFTAFVKAAFQYTSMMTTTGATSANYAAWPGFLPIILVLVGFMGACVGSTTGGLKVLRVHLMAKQAWREMQRLIHPSAQIQVKSGTAVVPNQVLQAVAGFAATYFALFTIMLLILLATGMDFISAFSGLANCMNNVGSGLGSVASNFSGVNVVGTWTLNIAMLLGRLEIYPLLLLFTPAFWRR